MDYLDSYLELERLFPGLFGHRRQLLDREITDSLIKTESITDPVIKDRINAIKYSNIYTNKLGQTVKSYKRSEVLSAIGDDPTIITYGNPERLLKSDIGRKELLHEIGHIYNKDSMATKLRGFIPGALYLAEVDAWNVGRRLSRNPVSRGLIEKAALKTYRASAIGELVGASLITGSIIKGAKKGHIERNELGEQKSIPYLGYMGIGALSSVGISAGTRLGSKVPMTVRALVKTKDPLIVGALAKTLAITGAVAGASGAVARRLARGGPLEQSPNILTDAEATERTKKGWITRKQRYGKSGIINH